MAERLSILFRVDANNTIGAGHFVRCVSLAWGFKVWGYKLVFVCHQSSQPYIERADEQFFDVCYLSTETQNNVSLECSEIETIAKKYDVKGIVVDGYQFHDAFRRLLREIQRPIVAIDDNNDRGDLYADIILNPSCNVDTHFDYIKHAHTQLTLLGDNFRLLRPEFIEQAIVPITQREHICIVMGGSDPLGLTLPIIKAIRESAFICKNKIVVVIGAGVSKPIKTEIITYIDKCVNDVCSSEKLNISYVLNPENIAQIYARSTLTISAAGGTQFELFALHCPSILLVAYDNQVTNSQYAENQGWAALLDVRKGVNSKQLVEITEQRLLPRFIESAHCTFAKSKVNGALNAAQKIMDFLASA